MVRHGALKGLYETDKTIGCGGFAKVKLATHLATGERVAIKIMDKRMLGDDLHRVTMELEALKNLNHDNICQLYQVLDTETHYFIVMEYCSGGELFDHIVEKNRLTESESRVFFRQIVSAVAYLHSLGYAHRDLKPENVLLDKYQNLKLIDFGLCAKPQGGMESLLYTSCGSPTYAAPELILGQQYLGPEVDVWAMGVLLYALLAGSLPFDDMNIDNLYRKILNGKYEEPPYISQNSKKLIRSMLQVDPKKRIKVSQLLNHPWLTLGILEPVKYNERDSMALDPECLQIIAKSLDVDEKTVRNELNKWKYDYNTVTYLLLLNKKKRGSPLKLHSTSGLKFTKSVQLPLIEIPADTNTPKQRIRRKLLKNRSPNCLSPNSVEGDVYSPSQFLEPSRKAVKRPRSPQLDDVSPVPPKKAATPHKAPINTPNKGPVLQTPDRRNPATETPGSARRMLGSIERSLQKVKYVLTPKKPMESIPSIPAVLNNKDLCNVSTTQCKDPELVIVQLSKGLEKKGISCTRKGFRLKGSLEPPVIGRLGGCSFELEICYLPSMGQPSTKQGDEEKLFVGIRRKRLKGDSWCYKKVCEQVLALTCAGFNNNTRDKLLESRV